MEKEMENRCVLKLHRMEFSRISFNRTGEKGDSTLSCGFGVKIDSDKESEFFRVRLALDANKKGEYEIGMEIMGIFSIADVEELPEITRKKLITENTVAILLPYLRSELSILTAQPGMEPVVLPPIDARTLVSEVNDG